MVVFPEKYQKMRYLLKFVPEVFEKYKSLFKFTKTNQFRMVDLGTGPGTMLLQIETLLPKNYKEIIGTDRAESMIHYFDSVPKDPRISGRILDISDEMMPEDFRERFDFAFSSFCFGYVSDLRKTFRNCNHLLKSQGETFFTWSTRSHMPEVFRSLSKIEKWAPYTSDYRNWKSLIEYDDPIGTLQDHLKVAGLNTIKMEEYKDFTFDEPEEVMMDAYDSLDHIQHRIPDIDQKRYQEDFDRIVRTEQMVFEETNNGRKPKVPCPAVVVVAQKH